MNLAYKTGWAGMFILLPLAADSAPVINEFIFNHSGSDSHEFVEVRAEAGADLSAYWLLQIEGDGSAAGTIDSAVQLGSAGSAGYWSSGFSANVYENGSVSLLLVEGFTGRVGDDLDADDDGVLDAGPWARLLDDVAVSDGGAGDRTYSASTLTPGFDAAGFTVGGASRIPDGEDSDTPADWVRNDFDGAGLPGFSGTVEISEALNTPAAENTTDPESAPPAPEFEPIYRLQGAGHRSPFLGQTVVSGGIVTAVAGNGFYLQDPVGDGDVATSDAIFVFTGGAPTVAPGDRIELSARVAEFIPGGAATANLSITEFSRPERITRLSSGNPLPAPVIIGAAGRQPPSEIIDDDGFAEFDPAADGIDFYESLEAMRVTVADAVAVAPRNRFGEIVVLADQGAGASGRNRRGGISIAPGDFNPERIQVQLDDTLLPGFDAAVNTGDRLGDVSGVVSYSFGNFELLATAPFAVAAGGLSPEVTELTAAKRSLRVASYNLLNLDPNDEDGDHDVGAGRFRRLAEIIVDHLDAPDILALQEVQDNDGSLDSGEVDAGLTYRTLIEAIAAAGGPRYAYADLPPQDGQDGGQPGGNIRVGFLYRPATTELVVDSLQRLLDPDLSDGDAFAGSRKPLAGRFRFGGQEFLLINNHFSSKGGSTPLFGVVQPPVNGNEDRRIAQARVVNDFVRQRLAEDSGARIMVLGDFNEFDFLAPLAVLVGEDDPVLINLTDTLPGVERYSFNFEGNSQALDHLLVTPQLAARAEYDIVHVDSEFSLPASDHDPLLARFSLAADPAGSVRFATFNASLNRGNPGQLLADLATPDNPQARAVAEIIQRAAPDVVLINEFDFDATGEAARLFRDHYLARGQNGAAPLDYPYFYTAPVNTGVASGQDLNNDGHVGGPDDALGFGFFPGQFGMVVYSRYPIETGAIRRFQHFLWRDMPGALLPDDPTTATPADWYSEAELALLPLSSKSHWDLPLRVRGRRVHLLVSHPTPPVFDGPEDRNGRRNHDEIRFWADYLDPEAGTYIYDDQGRTGGLAPGASFVILGDMNADPVDGDSTAGAILQLLEHARINTRLTPASTGAQEAALRQGGANAGQRGVQAFDSADFADGSAGNLRVDYVLPSNDLWLVDSAVFWPRSDEPLFPLVGDFPFPASDHRLVWADLMLAAMPTERSGARGGPGRFIGPE